MLDAIDPLGALLRALIDPAAWTAHPPEAAPLVSLTEATGDADVLAHPRGVLGVRQRVVPLGLPIERFGGAPLTGGPRSFNATFRIGDAVVTGSAVRDAWAPGDLFGLSDDEKLCPTLVRAARLREHRPRDTAAVARHPGGRGCGRLRDERYRYRTTRYPDRPTPTWCRRASRRRCGPGRPLR